MDDTTLAIMEALAAKIEALAARVEAAEKKLAEKCSCQTWETRREAHMRIAGVGE